MKKLSTSLLAMLFVFALAITATAQKRMTIEDALAMKNVGGPQISPDGKRIAYTISEWDKKENRRVSHIYLMATSGGQADQIDQRRKRRKRAAMVAQRRTHRLSGRQG
jgi:dipeptidyl aminopeptidase/acylaminoacyl peptidase